MKSIKLATCSKQVFAAALFTSLYLFVSSVFACDAPNGRFCVDFYRGTNLEGKPLTTQKTPFIKYNWKNRSPVRRIPYDNFSARWRGQFDFKDGPYEFRALADDGVRVLLDGKSILDGWQESAGTEFKAQVNPGAGKHLVEVEYFEATGNASIQVDWRQLPNPVIEANKIISSSGSISYLKTNSPPPKKMPLGTNLSYFSYSNAAVPFKDLIIQSGLVGVIKNKSDETCPEQPEFNNEGYPLYLPSGCRFRLISVFHILNDKFWPKDTQPYQAGHYVLLYQGKGKIRLSWDAANVKEMGNGRIEFDVPKPYAGIVLEVLDTEPSDPIRDLHMVHANDEASFRAQPFNENWLKLLEPYSVIRFMDWGRVSDTLKIYSGQAIAHTANTITLDAKAPTETGKFNGMVVMVNVDNKWPRVFIDRYDGNNKVLYLKTPIPVSETGKQPSIYISDFANRTWDKRTKPFTLGQGTEKGVAFELMIQMANILNVDPWFNIPTAADDEFIEQLAKLIKANLKPNLKPYIEYSNETWNSRFPGFNYAEAKAKELQLIGTGPQSDAWHPYRAIEIFKIFNRVFGEADLHADRQESRLVRVLTSQTAWLERSKRVMDWQMPNNAWPTEGHPAYAFADAWAVTTYFSVANNSDLDLPLGDEIFQSQIQSIQDLFGSLEKPGIIRQISVEAKSRNMRLVTYEGGTHLVAPSDKPALIEKLAQVNKDARMKDVYLLLIEKWHELYQTYGADTIGVWNHYYDVGRYGQSGYWGLLQSTYQNPQTAPKYQAITDFSFGTVK